MVKKFNSILKEVLKKVKPDKKDLEIIETSLKKFVDYSERKLKSMKLDAQVFVGGSYAKKTMIKKGLHNTQNQKFSVSRGSGKVLSPYDIDIFLRFDKNTKGNISELTQKILKDFKAEKIHGSRDYFRIKISKNVYFEVIPVIKIKKPEEAMNITDLSFFHVRYIKNKLKTKKLSDDIKLAKIFCYLNKCYGAESYIGGFSGYALELLIYYYGSFMKFIREISKNSKDKIIIDVEKFYKNKKDVLMDLNSSKLQSPIILIDPTYKQRNVLAALTKETFEKFKKVCKSFLKNPNKSFFEIQKPDLEKIKKDAVKKKYEFVFLKIKTDKQKGDIAGSKLLKFYRHLSEEIKDFFEIKKQGFEYGGGKIAEIFFAVKRKKEILFNGPSIKDKKNIQKFKKKHKKTFEKKGKIYAKEKIDFNIRSFLEKWKKKNQKKIKEMAITDLKIN